MMRRPAQSKRPTKSEIAQTASRVAPVRGWNARDPEASMRPEFALKLENWWPTTGGVETRPGAADHVTGFASPVKALMTWEAASGSPSRRLFAATDAGIYDATTAGAVGASVSSLTSGECVHTNFRTSGNSYLFVVNGVDSIRHYQGAAWTTVASYSDATPTVYNTTEFSHVNVFKRRLFFIRKNSLDFFYLPEDSIAGTIALFPLGGLASLGGHLVAMATWTIDGGNGADDYAVFVTSKGQVIVYAGTNPSDPTAWALVGVYNLAPPVGKKCFLKYGGDLLLITESGIFPLSQALKATAERAALAVTNTIEGAFSSAANSYRANFGWDIQMLLTKNLLLINIPTTSLSSSEQFVMNTQTKAWAKVTGWNAFCFEIFNGRLYMGMSTKVAEAWTGTADFGSNITCIAKTAFDQFGLSRNKHFTLLRPVFRASGTISVSVALDMDFEENTDFGAAVFVPASGSLWDVALWDVGVWGSRAATQLQWITVHNDPGRYAATRLRVITQNATVFWTSTDYVFETGGIL